MGKPVKPDKTGSAIKRDGKLDPSKLDVAAERKPKRKRKARNRPDPDEELREAEDAMERRVRNRPHPPGVILEPAGMGEEHWTSPHNDIGLWTLQLADAFGTRSRAVFITFMKQLEKLCDRDIWDEDAQQWRLDEYEFSGALGIINSTKPANELEACHAAQMVAVHLMQMKLSARALKYQGDVRTAAVAGKLARTFTEQLRLQQELKGKKKPARQSIKVTRESHHHQHIHVHRGEGEGNSDEQPQEPRADTIEGRATVQGPCEVHRLPVPSSGGSGADGLPQARRGKSRRTEG